jgi:signal transduction histidine kinase
MELNLLQNATLLAESDLSLTQKEFSSLGQDFIDDVIGDDKVNMIVAIYSAKGKVLYRNDNAYIFELPDEISPDFEMWEDTGYNDYFIKYLTQKDHKHSRIIKVGMILNQSLIRWKDLNQRIFVFVGIILSVIAVISFFLTYLLFRPVQVLAEHVNRMAEKIESGEFNEFQTWFQKLNSKAKRNDEFSLLLKSLDTLGKKLSENQQMTQRWSALMAHELKTPMTLLRMSIDEMIQESQIQPKAISSIEIELNKLESIIINFLEWASAENDPSRPEIHAIDVGRSTREIIKSLQKANSHVHIELQNHCDDDFRIFCNPIHFDQLLNNLLSNALKYGDGKVTVRCQNGKLMIQDNGKGIPDKVMRNFGKPFNKFTQQGADGHGLGLAWISTITNKYKWEIKIDNSHGTKIEIQFS